MSAHYLELKFFHIGGCLHGPLLIVTRNPMDVTESFEGLQDNSRTKWYVRLDPARFRCSQG
jgi:hypothetical protein